mmetsp:Transcript_16445/g.31029  ORF Transcript_16445/g.31029 Transcript_16445/m.31029 type:complete len:150 (-) Transcript_16445:104-553(-)
MLDVSLAPSFASNFQTSLPEAKSLHRNSEIVRSQKWIFDNGPIIIPVVSDKKLALSEVTPFALFESDLCVETVNVLRSAMNPDPKTGLWSCPNCTSKNEKGRNTCRVCTRSRALPSRLPPTGAMPGACAGVEGKYGKVGVRHHVKFEID